MTKEELESLGIQGLSEETVTKMAKSLQEKIEDVVTKTRVELQSEITSLKETIELLEHEREDLIEKADEYAKTIREELNEKIEEREHLVREEMIEQGEAYGQHLAEEYANKLESYAQYVVEQFVESNKKILSENKHYEKMKGALDSIRETLAESLNLTVEQPDEVRALESQLEESKAEYNKLASSYAQLNESVEALERTQIFEEFTKTLADTQREKVQRLMEGMDTRSKEDYRRTLKLMVEEVIGKEKTITEDVTPQKKITSPGINYDGNVKFPSKEEPDFQERMQRYLASLV